MRPEKCFKQMFLISLRNANAIITNGNDTFPFIDLGSETDKCILARIFDRVIN